MPSAMPRVRTKPAICSPLQHQPCCSAHCSEHIRAQSKSMEHTECVQETRERNAITATCISSAFAILAFRPSHKRRIDVFNKQESSRRKCREKLHESDVLQRAIREAEDGDVQVQATSKWCYNKSAPASACTIQYLPGYRRCGSTLPPVSSHAVLQH